MKKILLFTLSIISLKAALGQNNSNYYLSCAPKKTTSNVFIKADLKTKWFKDNESYVGLSSSFIARETIFNKEGVFLKGDLISPRGGKLNVKENGVTGDFYVLFKEWDCEVYRN
jgi:hypothetical protein